MIASSAPSPDGTRWKGHARVLGPNGLTRRANILGRRNGLYLLAGPLSGMVVQLLIGALADSSTSRWGRRRPYVLGGCLVCVVGMLLLGYTRAVAATVTTWGSPANDRLTVALAVLSIFIIDFAWTRLLICAGGGQRARSAHARHGSSLAALAPLVSLLLLACHLVTALLVRVRVLLGGSANINPSLLTTLRDIWSNACTLVPRLRCARPHPLRSAMRVFLSFSGAWRGRREYHPAGHASACQGSAPSLYCSPFEYLLAVGWDGPPGHGRFRCRLLAGDRTCLLPALSSLEWQWADTPTPRAQVERYAPAATGPPKHFRCPRRLLAGLGAFPLLVTAVGLWCRRCSLTPRAVATTGQRGISIATIDRGGLGRASTPCMRTAAWYRASAPVRRAAVALTISRFRFL
ncbi:hypothetical protein C8J57DRAFT_1719959 [Mycena rebaudengoi]|nr:hypothetical protein C8J57DRAFT_1719959 [Mycena rebaudengoi]